MTGVPELAPLRFGRWTFVRRRLRLWGEADGQGFLLDGQGHGSVRLKLLQEASILLPDGSRLGWTRPEPIQPRSSLGQSIAPEGDLGSWCWKCDGRVLRFEHAATGRTLELEAEQCQIRVEDRTRSNPLPTIQDGPTLTSRRGVLTIEGLDMTPRQLELLQLLVDADCLSARELRDLKGPRAPGHMEELRISLAEQNASLITMTGDDVYRMNHAHERWVPNE